MTSDRQDELARRLLADELAREAEELAAEAEDVGPVAGEEAVLAGFHAQLAGAAAPAGSQGAVASAPARAGAWRLVAGLLVVVSLVAWSVTSLTGEQDGALVPGEHVLGVTAALDGGGELELVGPVGPESELGSFVWSISGADEGARLRFELLVEGDAASGFPILLHEHDLEVSELAVDAAGWPEAVRWTVTVRDGLGAELGRQSAEASR